jgi:hypothetical protein
MTTSTQLTFDLDPILRLVFVVGTGDTKASDWIALFDRVLATPRFRPGTDFLIDRRAVTSVPSRHTVQEIVRYFARHAEQLGHCRIASVTADDAAYQMNRVAAVSARHTTVRVQVFRTMQSAYRWLRPELASANGFLHKL